MAADPPTVEGFLVFIRTRMGIPEAVLPDDSEVIPFAFDVALEIVNKALAQVSALIYSLAVYNLAGSNVINFAQDADGAPNVAGAELPYFANLRSIWDINSFISGVISSAGDEGTNESMVVQKAAEDFTLADLQYLKDPYGRQYLAFAQRYGTLVGLT